MQRVASYLAGENEATFHEDECRKYGSVPTLLEIELPDGEVPALEGERLDDHAAREWHASPLGPSSSFSSHSHSRFQNTLATSAGLTAVISATGTLYAFGRAGRFSPNIFS